MGSLTTLTQSLGVAYAAGINLPATVAVLGIADRAGWIDPLPGALAAAGSIWVIALASILYLMEFVVTLIPGVASVWETVQSIVRPPAAALLAVATTYHLSPGVMVAAGLVGGGLALTTHGTKLGLRYAVDTSPEPVTTAANATTKSSRAASTSATDSGVPVPAAPAQATAAYVLFGFATTIAPH